jgi:hypothetical protein
MKMIRYVIGAIAVACGCAMAVSPALAHEFKSSVSGSVKAHNTSTLVFHGSGGTVDCFKGTSTGKVNAGTTKLISGVVEYRECENSEAGLVEVSNGEFQLSAEGWVTLLNEVVVKVPRGECNVKVAPTGNKELKGMLFENNKTGTLTIDAAVTGITYTSSGGNCGSSGKNGEAKGNSVSELEPSGVLEWK